MSSRVLTGSPATSQSDSAIHTPISTTSTHDPASTGAHRDDNMDDNANNPETSNSTTERQPQIETSTSAPSTTIPDVKEPLKTSKSSPAKKAKCKMHDKQSSRKPAAKCKETRKASRKQPSEASSSDSSESDASSSDSSCSDEASKKKRTKKLSKAKDKKRRKNKSAESSSESSASEESDSEDSDSSVEDEKPKKKKKKKLTSKKTAKKGVKKSKKTNTSSSEDSDTTADKSASLQTLQAQIDEIKLEASQKGKDRSSKKDKADSLPFKKVDQLWDTTRHEWTLHESSGKDESEFAEFAFLVRRTFNYENEFRCTLVDIKAKLLRDALAEVMDGCKRVSFEAEEPTIDPNLLFLYLEELRTYYKKTLTAKITAERKRKVVKKLTLQRSLVKTLVAYIDEDYSVTKKTLYPLLAAGNITFELLWALYKPNEIAISGCYGCWDEPRCFRVEHANKLSSMSRGDWYCVEGKYLEYDGKAFGFGDYEVNVEDFKGPRKITSLATYPLKYHGDPENVKKMIIERGRHFTSLDGMEYRFHSGLAFYKKKKAVGRININGRIMIDPQTFRRINPNYQISIIKPHESEDLYEADSDEDSDSDACGCCSDSDDEGGDEGNKAPKKKYKIVKVKDKYHMVEVDVDEEGGIIHSSAVAEIERKSQTWSDEELLLTSPVVLGFAFNEKLWLEFSISGVREIEYNEAAFESLVLPPNQKSIVRALVESHKFHAAKTIDDVVQGKGKGLVAVLHGPPGTGKTLTAEGISELLQCPLYMVSAGELGTDPAKLESELQKILDIAHSWGAVLLLDEADVFLEKREVHDIHRNALVSIFLRLLEYFQGILFLTTNRVETFDDAFQSRIHVALRYGELTPKAKKSVWRMFIEKCRAQPGTKVAEFSETQLDNLAKHSLNGRQIKNVVRTAQALALNENEVLGMEQIRRVLEVADDFERDLKGGTGYVEAMRSYT